MSTPPKEVLILGSGRRVRETALPAFARLSEEFRLRRIVAKTAKTIESEAVQYDVACLADLRKEALQGVDLIYMAVAKDAVPSVLRALVALLSTPVDLLIDTPVVRFRHFRQTAHLKAFRRVSVAEDCHYLPWIDTLRAFLQTGQIGPLLEVQFQQSAYAYHTTASAKALFGATHIRSARRRRMGAVFAERHLRLNSGGQVRLLEPRDYGVGRLLCIAQRGSVSDYPLEAEHNHWLEPIDAGGSCRGFRIGDTVTQLDDAESDLMRGKQHGPRVTGRMENMKRVGFLRLLRRIAQGELAYPLAQALEDMVVDYHLERFGRYLATPFTRPDALFGKALLRAVTR